MTATTLPLWPSRDPEGPSLTLHPSGAVSAHPLAVMVCPGGGYQLLADHEREPVARALNARGFHAAVLKYRVAPHAHPAPLHDALRGMRLTRQHADAFAAAGGAAPTRFAVLGFSAGGHLAATLCVHHDHAPDPDDDLADTRPARPDAAVLCYPVIDLAGHPAHSGSRDKLLGDEPDPAVVDALSAHTRVTAETCPAFLWHTVDDEVVDVENSLLYAAACRAHGVPFELHAYEAGRHGLGLARDVAGAPAMGHWIDLAADFLRRRVPTASCELATANET